MQISFSPQRRDDSLVVSKAGDALTINGASFDFTSLPDGATIPAGQVPCPWILGPVRRVAGAIHLTLILPHGPKPSPGVAFPAALTDPPDGPLAIPQDDQTEEANHVDA
jgi:hypothetical protein